MSSADGILFFLCLNDRGGAEISMVKLACGLAAAGRRVTLAVYGFKPALGRELGFTGDIVDLATERTSGALIPLYRILRSGRFAIVVSALTHTNIVAVIAARLARRGVQVIATEHGGGKLYAAWSLLTALTRLAYARAACVVAVSQGLAQSWRGILPHSVNIITIYNPVVADAPAVLDSLPPHPWLMQKEIPVIIAIGRLKEEKNFSLLIKAFARTCEKQAALLIILGEGEERPGLEALARDLGVQDKILMPGFITDPQNWLAHATLFISASNREGFGNVIVEALSCGVPVVSTDCPYGPAEILARGRYGRLVPVDDCEALAAALAETLLSQPDKSLLRARAAAFTVARCISGYEALIDKLRPSRVQ